MAAPKILDFSVLNPPQLEAVMHTHGPLLVLAGAGSGKTRVITYRIARLIRDGIAPENILAVTFTNKAASEMRERVGHLTSRRGKKGLTVSTFHALGHRLLRECGQAAGLMPQFSIYDQGEQLGTIKRIFRDIKIDDRNFDAKRILSMISKYKNNGVAPEDAPIIEEDDYTLMAKEVYGRYQEQLRREQAVDFDDLLVRPARLLTEREELRDYYRRRFQFILVDEYQDTNPIQFTLLTALCPPGGNLCVVGDDDQAIYGFRGAEVDHILNFAHRYPGAKEIALEQNYRSTGNILAAANAVISKNTKRKAKALWTSFGTGDVVEARGLADDEAEARFVAQQILSAASRGHKHEDIAVLYRSNIQSRAIEEQLRFEQIPYRVVGGMEYFERKEVKDAISYLRVVANPDDELSLRRIINYPARGVGEVAFTKLQAAANGSLYNTLAAPPADLKTGVREALRTLHGHLEAARATLSSAPTGAELGAMATALLEAMGLRQAIYDEFENLSIAARKIENIEHLCRSLEQFAEIEPEQTLEKFLGQLALEAPEEKEKADTGGVTLITIHAAKGLEWPWVFLVGMEEELLPHKRTIEDVNGDLSEERRLCYVGITRARERLWLTHAKSRKKYGTIVPRTPSRFLDELGDTVQRMSDDASNVNPEEQEKMADDFFAKMRAL
jgi:DNA helicase-2/ATP-dependent DNA helicase PcrA